MEMDLRLNLCSEIKKASGKGEQGHAKILNL